MMAAEDLPDAARLGAPRWVWAWLTGIAAFLTFCVVVLGVVSAVSSIERTRRIDDSNQLQVCIAHLQGRFFSHIAQLLTLPPDQRAAVVEAIEQDGRRLQDPDHHC